MQDQVNPQGTQGSCMQWWFRLGMWPCLAQENEQPANNHDEVIYFYYNSQ